MGDGGVGLARRDFNALSAGGNAAIAGSVPNPSSGPSQNLLAGPESPGVARGVEDPTGIYSLRGVYFNPQQFSSIADCLTAASAQNLPLELCR